MHSSMNRNGLSARRVEVHEPRLLQLISPNFRNVAGYVGLAHTYASRRGGGQSINLVNNHS